MSTVSLESVHYGPDILYYSTVKPDSRKDTPDLIGLHRRQVGSEELEQDVHT